MKLEQIAVSPCSNPERGLDDVLMTYSATGFRQIEAFTSWAKSALDYRARDTKNTLAYLASAFEYVKTYCKGKQ